METTEIVEAVETPADNRVVVGVIIGTAAVAVVAGVALFARKFVQRKRDAAEEALWNEAEEASTQN